MPMRRFKKSTDPLVCDLSCSEGVQRLYFPRDLIDAQGVPIEARRRDSKPPRSLCEFIGRVDGETVSVVEHAVLRCIDVLGAGLGPSDA